MQKMLEEYAQKILDGGYAFGNRFHSRTDELLVAEYSEDEYPYSGPYFVGAKLNNGELVVDDEGYVHFSRVTSIIDENTRFKL